MGPKIEADITELVLQNNTILRLGIAFEFPDSRHRVTTKLIENMDEGKTTKYSIPFSLSVISKTITPVRALLNKAQNIATMYEI